ncbi:hypothetical protein CVT24_012099 [Panaeolus cyanescens]|uniref:BZIP domain-containing protein n=1 Tax=Panaeolus cyanescens TaxID=181874 RepID=A0A409WDM6_9AGAR|nr:hypothetical protein CVT24_012099 [Panaeolus cyanescens]
MATTSKDGVIAGSPVLERAEPVSTASNVATSSEQRPSSIDASFVNMELISPTSRISRLPTTSTVPSQTSSNPVSTNPVAIPQQTSTTTTSGSGQDVHLFVNNQTSASNSVPRSTATSSPLETNVSSYPQPLTQHGLNHPIRRPRTSQVFQSTTDLAAQYGIPQVLPPAPRLNQPASSSSSPTVSSSNTTNNAFSDWTTLLSNYQNMLKTPSNPASPEMPTAPAQPTEAVAAQAGPAQTLDLTGMHYTASLLYDSKRLIMVDFTPTGGVYDTSPYMYNLPPYLTPDLDNSPLDDSLIADYLSTPLITDDSMLTSPGMEYDGLALFGGVESAEKDAQSVAQDILKQLDMTGLEIMSPYTPMLDTSPSFPMYHTVLPNLPESAPAPTATVPSTITTAAETATSTRRRSNATGIRKGITPDALLDEDAPTQPRKYTTPSSTSRKEVPAVFARKRARSTAFGDEDDELSSPNPMPLNPTEKDLIEMKRRQNTVAARRSRKRKLEQMLALETRVQELEKERDMWKSRAETYSGMLNTMGHNIPPSGDF